MKSIVNWQIPKTIKNIRSFLGLASYYRRFVKDFATISAPLNNLTKKNMKWKWDDKCDKAFNTLKYKLANAPIVRCPNNDYQFILQTDASTVGIGSVLSQRDKDGSEYVVEYASRTLNKAERNYSTIERECLAIVWGVIHFRPYLFGVQFIIQSDHKPLRYLNQMKDLNGRLTRWSLRLQEYTFDLEYKKGKSNANADAMSRLMINVLNKNENDINNDQHPNHSISSQTSQLTAHFSNWRSCSKKTLSYQ